MGILQELRWYLRPLKIMNQCNKEGDWLVDFKRERACVCWVVGTADHMNLGDHAISHATMKYVSNILPEVQVVQIPEEECYSSLKQMKRNIRSKDFIILQGGGNFGDQYYYTEQIRRTYIKKFKHNYIILFPQTMHFTDSKRGEKELKLSQKIYKKNKNLVLCAREEVSFGKMKKLFPHNNAQCCPDIVLSLEDVRLKEECRSGALICIRNDIEGTLDNDTRQILIKKICGVYNEITELDTVCSKKISSQDREEVLREIWKNFSSVELVLTDRLHGMIFAAITGTPCIVLDNTNHKVEGVYKWISHFSYIKFFDSPEKITEEEIFEVCKKKYDRANWQNVREKFEVLKGILSEVSKNNGEN